MLRHDNVVSDRDSNLIEFWSLKASLTSIFVKKKTVNFNIKRDFLSATFYILPLLVSLLKCCMHFSSFAFVLHARPSHPPLIITLIINDWWTFQIMKLITTKWLHKQGSLVQSGKYNRIRITERDTSKNVRGFRNEHCSEHRYTSTQEKIPGHNILSSNIL